MPIDENLLWSRTIDPITGKIVKEETFVNAALTGLAVVAVVVLLAVLVSIL
jgi:hypothetical protein